MSSVLVEIGLHGPQSIEANALHECVKAATDRAFGEGWPQIEVGLIYSSLTGAYTIVRALSNVVGDQQGPREAPEVKAKVREIIEGCGGKLEAEPYEDVSGDDPSHPDYGLRHDGTISHADFYRMLRAAEALKPKE